MPSVRTEYRLTPGAERDLEFIWLDTSEASGREQANGYTDDLANAFSQPAHNPKLGMRCEDIRRGYRRLRVGRHVVYYRMSNFGIAVVRVLDKRMLQTRHLQGAT